MASHSVVRRLCQMDKEEQNVATKALIFGDKCFSSCGVNLQYHAGAGDNSEPDSRPRANCSNGIIISN
jgi:hypothetical protein